jgi:hypothetical protein
MWLPPLGLLNVSKELPAAMVAEEMSMYSVSVIPPEPKLTVADEVKE